VTTVSYRLPNGAVPLLLSADAPDLVVADAAALLSYLAAHPAITPQALADMLFRTRTPRRYRALAMVDSRDDLVSAWQAVVDGQAHPYVVRTTPAISAGRVAYVFPGQGSQRPGMGRLFYEAGSAYREEADRCAAVFEEHFGASPLKYVLDELFPAGDSARVVQPALFTHMAALAAMWRSFGVSPDVTVGHSQGEIAAAYTSGAMTLPDAARVVGIRAHAADEFARGDYAMAVVAARRDDCEGVLARCTGWAELSVVNSPTLVGISGDREAVGSIVDTFAERGAFARVIRVDYPAHTTLMKDLSVAVRANIARELQNPKFLDTETDCIGATLGEPLTNELPLEQYWFLNLRNTVRFDKAIAATSAREIDIYIELSDHSTLQLATHENLAAVGDEHARVLVGTSARTAENLDEFTRNLMLVAVNDPDYPWGRLGLESDGPAPLPLPDFPNSAMRAFRSWLPYSPAPQQQTAPPVAAPAPRADTSSPRLLVEQWVRLSQRSLVPPRAIGIVDHLGSGTDLASDMCNAAKVIGATARLIDVESRDDRAGLDTHVILVPQSPDTDDPEAAAAVAEFFGNRIWWPGIDDGVTDCWLVTTGGEAVVSGDEPPDLVSAAAGAGFRSIGAEHPGVRFRHLDLPRGSGSAETALAIVTALHTGEESELALRSDGFYAKRVVEAEAIAADSDAASRQHVLVIGGTGNLGLEFCEHFARRGARRITLVSRSGETAAVADRLRRMRLATSTKIEVISCDVSDHAAVSRLAAESQDAPADLIIHAAVEYSGAELEDITVEAADRALRAKVVGIALVLAAFPRADDCRVVLCSSIGANVGGRGLVLYAAANRMLDAMALRLRADGLDCVAVQWGQWSVTFDPAASGTAKLGVTGLLPMSPADALALGMGRLPGNAIVAAFDLDRARSVLETCGRASLLSALDSQVVTTHARGNDADLPQRFLTLLAGTIGVDSVDTIDTTVPMVAIGLDSLQALEFRRRVKLEFDHDLEVTDLLGGASVGDVLATLVAQSG